MNGKRALVGVWIVAVETVASLGVSDGGLSSSMFSSTGGLLRTSTDGRMTLALLERLGLPVLGGALLNVARVGVPRVGV